MSPTKPPLARSTATTPQPDTAWFVESRFGLFIHWGLYALGARHEWVKRYEEMTDEFYRRFFDHFDPDLYDPVAWARMARAAGMKYMVVTTRHHDGFCLWDSLYTDFKATRTPAKRDLLKPLVDAFRQEGLRIGFYYSLLDWTHPDFPVDRNHPRASDSTYREAHQGRDVRQYAAYMRNQVTELLTQFGKIDLMWYDFSYPGEDGKGRDDWESETLLALTRQLQPGIIVNNRLDLPYPPDFVTPEQYQPMEPMRDATGQPVIWEGCQTFSGSWGYHRDEQSWKNVKQLLWLLIDGVSKNGNLLLNVGPTARGEFDQRARDRLTGLAGWMHYHARSIYGCGPAPEGIETPPDCRYTYNASSNRLYLHVFNWPIKFVYLPGLNDRVEYAQLLHDASEVQIKARSDDPHSNMQAATADDVLTLLIPNVPPPVEVPVIELFLKS